MPKIPQFKSGGQLQIGDSGRIPVATQSLKQTEIISDVSDIITEFGIKQKTIEDKTEALELENASVIELNSAVQEASKMINKEFYRLVGAETVALAKAGVTREGTSLRLSRQNAEEAQLQRNIIVYNAKVAQTQKINEANYLRYSGQVARAEAKMAQVSTAIKGFTSVYSMGGFKNKSLLQNQKTFTGFGQSGYGRDPGDIM